MNKIVFLLLLFAAMGCGTQQRDTSAGLPLLADVTTEAIAVPVPLAGVVFSLGETGYVGHLAVTVKSTSFQNGDLLVNLDIRHTGEPSSRMSVEARKFNLVHIDSSGSRLVASSIDNSDSLELSTQSHTAELRFNSVDVLHYRLTVITEYGEAVFRLQ